VAIRPGYWQPAHFASAAATLDHLSGGRLLVNVVSGQDNLAAYGDVEGDRAERYARTKEFLQIVRRLWTEENVTFRGRYFGVEGATLSPRPYGAGEGRHPRLYFGGASAAAEQVSATEADVQLFWGEPLGGVAERIDRLKALTKSLGRAHPPLEFGLRITTLVRDSAEEAWRDAEGKVAKMAERAGQSLGDGHRGKAVRAWRGARLLSLHHPRQVRRRRRGYHLAGRLVRRGGRRPAEVPGSRSRGGCSRPGIHATFRRKGNDSPWSFGYDLGS
jgi:alkanesulfonate monooxygenase